MYKKFISSVLLIGFVSMFAGCNTIEGAGEDIEAGGEKIQEKSQDVRNN